VELIPVHTPCTGPYEKFDPQKVHNSLTAGSLRGPGKLAIAPMVFAKEDESEAVGELGFRVSCLRVSGSESSHSANLRLCARQEKTE